jgi:hypothetical protein
MGNTKHVGLVISTPASYRKVPSMNFTQEAGYPDKFSCEISSSHNDEYGDDCLLGCCTI